MTLYQTLRAIGAEMDNHYSDLHVRATPEVMQAVREHRPTVTWEAFTDATTGARWLDVPFAFDPYWERRVRPLDGARTTE